MKRWYPLVAWLTLATSLSMFLPAPAWAIGLTSVLLAGALLMCFVPLD